MSQAVVEEPAEEAEFRARARAFLERVAEPKVGNTDLRTTLGNTDTSRATELAHVDASRKWQRTLHEHGWAGIAWPKEYGGLGLAPKFARIFAQEESKFNVSVGFFSVAMQMVAPTIMVHGTEEQKQRFLPQILAGEHLWCQLFSEPGAGSDLAGLTTRADRDGDEFVINGQKVWNSGAHYADWGILLAVDELGRAEAPWHHLLPP